jgi:hypothetical protein
MMPRGRGALLPCALLIAVQLTAAATRDEAARDAPLSRFLAGDATPLIGYRAVRTLTASTRGGSTRGRLVAITSDDADTGFQFTVIEESGSSVIRNRVLRAALDAEKDIRVRGESSTNALSTRNYRFGPVETAGDDLMRVSLQPLRKDAMLVDGALLLTGDGDLVRVEGTLVKRPSFWTRRVDVRREYGRINGVRVPLRMQSTARVLVVGTSEFEMTYAYESVNGRAVDTAAP